MPLSRLLGKLIGRKSVREAPVIPLPPEIVDYIISFVDDRKTLRSCAVVCRGWLPASRYKLFHRIVISKGAKFKSLQRLIRSPSMLQCLAVVEELRVPCFTKTAPKGQLFKPPFIEVIQLLAVHLVGLRSMRIQFHYGCWLAPLEETFLTSLSYLSRLVELDMDHIQFSAFSDFQRFVCSFPQLASLSMASVCWNVSDSLAGAGANLRLESLRVGSMNGSYLPPLLEWLICTPCCRTTKSFHCQDQYFYDGAPAPIVNRWLRTLGEHLEHLTIPLSSEIDLSRNVNLLSLVVPTHIVTVWGWEMASEMLCGVRSSKLAELTLSLQLWVIYALPQEEGLWQDDPSVDGVDQVLMQERFESLRTVTVCLETSFIVPRQYYICAQHELQTRMRHVHSRGILRVTHSPMEKCIPAPFLMPEHVCRHCRGAPSRMEPE